MSQNQGLKGKLVGQMIRRSVRTRFHAAYWRKSKASYRGPAILYANHHGWMDGYLMYLVVSKLGLRSVDWIEEFDTFPLFASVGGMRFPKGNPIGRAQTIRQTIRTMVRDSVSLVLFPEGVLHRPPAIQSFGRAIETVAKHVPNVAMVPVAIHYEMSMHERPEAWISVGDPHQFESKQQCEDRLQSELRNLREGVGDLNRFELLSPGTRDINERMSLKRFATP